MPKAAKPKVHYAVSRRVVTLVKKVQKHILAEPKRLDMADWTDSLSTRFPEDGRYGEPSPMKQQYYPACGTTACIAGWTVLLSEKAKRDSRGWLIIDTLRDYASEAEKLLEVADGDGDFLFHVGDWPDPYGSQYNDTSPSDRQAQAKITAARLEHFIRTGA